MRIFLGFLAALLLAAPAWGQTVPSYNQVPTCSAVGTARAACGAVAGRNSIVRFNDAFADTLGGVIVGGGANEVLGWCEGTTCWNIGTDNGLLAPLFVENTIDADDVAIVTENVVTCGQLDENGTIYLGPAVAAFLDPSTESAIGGTVCDALDNATEATVDAPIFTDLTFQVMGMWCTTDGTLGAGETIVFTARSAAANLNGSLTCTISEAESDCSAVGGVTTDIAAGATIAVQAVMASNNADDNAWCRWTIGVK